MSNYSVIGPAGDAFQVDGIWHQDYNVQDTSTGEHLVKRYKHNGSTWELAEGSKLDLTKNIPDTPAGINLKKSVINLDKTFINLKKTTGFDLGGHRARVGVVVDFSGSMRPLYRDGSVQRALNRLIPLALRFDDNGELDIWLFHNSYRRMESMALNNFDRYVDDVIIASGERFGGTKYAPVLEDTVNYYCYGKSYDEPPAFVIFITDGDNSDKAATNNIVRALSNENIFVQFVGIGDEEFEYLQKLDNLKGRDIDNTGFISVKSFESLSDDQLYEKLLEQYIQWLKVTGRR